MVGDYLTVADLQLTLAIVELQQMVLDTNFRNSLNNLNAHFKLITELPAFKNRMGAIRQGKKQLLPGSLTIEAPKAEKAVKTKGKK